MSNSDLERLRLIEKLLTHPYCDKYWVMYGNTKVTDIKINEDLSFHIWTVDGFVDYSVELDEIDFYEIKKITDLDKLIESLNIKIYDSIYLDENSVLDIEESFYIEHCLDQLEEDTDYFTIDDIDTLLFECEKETSSKYNKVWILKLKNSNYIYLYYTDIHHERETQEYAVVYKYNTLLELVIETKSIFNRPLFLKN